jgi:hypothetical protein
VSEDKAKILPTELARDERRARLEGAIWAAVRGHMRRDPPVTVDDVVSVLGALADVLGHEPAVRDELLREVGRSPGEGD